MLIEFKGIRLSCWIWVLILNVVYIGFIICIHLIFTLDVLDMTSMYMCLVLDINVLYAFPFFKLIEKILRVWIKKVQNSRNITESETKEHWNLIYDMYLHIIDVYIIIEATLRLMVCVSLKCRRTKICFEERCIIYFFLFPDYILCYNNYLHKFEKPGNGINFIKAVYNKRRI